MMINCSWHYLRRQASSTRGEQGVTSCFSPPLNDSKTATSDNLVLIVRIAGNGGMYSVAIGAVSCEAIRSVFLLNTVKDFIIAIPRALISASLSFLLERCESNTSEEVSTDTKYKLCSVYFPSWNKMTTGDNEHLKATTRVTPSGRPMVSTFESTNAMLLSPGFS